MRKCHLIERIVGRAREPRGKKQHARIATQFVACIPGRSGVESILKATGGVKRSIAGTSIGRWIATDDKQKWSCRASEGRSLHVDICRVHDRIRHEGVRRSCSSSGCVWYRQKVKLETLESGRGSGQSTVGKAQLMVSIWGAGITEWYVRSDTDRGFRRYARTMIGNSLVVTEQALPQ
jgi:hypothetical protein